MTAKDQLWLEKKALDIRAGILDGVYAAKSGHPGGSLGAADILAVLYFHEMNVDPKNPRDEDRDRFVLSKGHNAPALYAALAHRGYFPVEDLQTLRHIGSHLQGHPNMNSTPGVDMSTGSLGQGVSAACGMALGLQMKDSAARVYTLLGDGELAEGECWEAFMFARHYHLDNLCVIIDINGLQIDGRTRDVLDIEPIDSKMQTFGFEVFKVNGNDIAELNSAFSHARNVRGRPSCILAHTMKGRGVSFMGNNAVWHGKAPNAEEYREAKKELAKAAAKWEGQWSNG